VDKKAVKYNTIVSLLLYRLL